MGIEDDNPSMDPPMEQMVEKLGGELEALQANDADTRVVDAKQHEYDLHLGKLAGGDIDSPHSLDAPQ